MALRYQLITFPGPQAIRIGYHLPRSCNCAKTPTGNIVHHQPMKSNCMNFSQSPKSHTVPFRILHKCCSGKTIHLPGIKKQGIELINTQKKSAQYLAQTKYQNILFGETPAGRSLTEKTIRKIKIRYCTQCEF